MDHNSRQRRTLPATLVLIIAALVLSAGVGVLRPAQAEEVRNGRVFSERDVRGPYGFSFQGFLTLTLSDGSSLPVPVSAVGRLVADGRGGIEAARTLSLGGLVLEQDGVGVYEVQPDGTGSARFDIVVVDQTGTPPPGVELPNATVESFAFVLTNFAGGIRFIGTGVLDAASHEPIGAVAIRGEAHAQR